MDAQRHSDLTGCVVGRFQPFHRDHLSLVERVVEERGRVIVAVTNADATWRVPMQDAPHRHVPDANPFTYWQRAEMIRAATAPTIAPGNIYITPFPIHDPANWDSYLPRTVECWVRDRGSWEEAKVKLLATRYAVRSIPAVDVEVSGTDIRRRLLAGDQSWQQDVPAAVALLVRAWTA